MTAGNIVFLNGASSSGKTTIARHLQEILDDRYTIMSVDKFLAAMHNWNGEHGPDYSDFPKEVISQRISAFHHCIGAMARAGLHQIVDHLFASPEWLEECVRLWQGLPVYLVAVHCSLPELRRRERERGDRHIGLAEKQAGKVHQHGVYDLEIDTTSADPLACAYAVRNLLGQRLDGPAVELLAEVLLESDERPS